MLELQEITIEKKEELNRFLSRRCSQNSEFTFTNLFMWRKSYDIKYLVLDDMLCLMPKHADGPRSATFPIGFVNEDGSERDVFPVVNTLLEECKLHGYEPLLRIYDERALQKLTDVFPGKFLISEDINSFDYVYRVEDLINLSGKKYHAKKNHINKFKSLYSWEYQPISKENLDECLELFGTWHEKKGEEVFGLDEEREAVQELFNHWDELDVRGGCIRVDGKMVAFSVGEPLCGKTVVIHLEHADTDYQGAFAIMNQQFLEHEWKEFEFVNREEDMGIPGMRKVKESYRPAFMVKKYVATLI